MKSKDVKNEIKHSTKHYCDSLDFMMQPPIVHAILSGNYDEVKSILQEDEEAASVCDSEKRSPLHVAAFAGFADTVEILITEGKARVNAKDNHWLTPLHRACRSSSEDVVSILLKHNADVKARDKNWITPGHIAAANNAVACMEQMIDSMTSNFDLSDKGGRSGLHHAAHLGHYEMAELLIDKGKVPVDPKDKQERRPLHYAAFGNHADVVRLLLARGADVNAVDKEDFTALHAASASGAVIVVQQLLEADTDVLATNAFGNSPIHTACLNGHGDILTNLLTALSDLKENVFDLLNSCNQSPLHLAAASQSADRCFELLMQEPLAETGINAKDSDNRTPLHMAALYGRLSRATMLIDNHAEVNAVDNRGQTPLHVAAKHGHGELIGPLLSAGADPTLQDVQGNNPLHLCARFGFVECCRKLVAGIDINCVNNDKRTALHLSAFKGDIDSLDFLMASHADINMVDRFGRLPLHYAASRAWFDCCYTLVSGGSDVNRQDMDGKTPLMLACVHDDDGKSVEYLLNHKADPCIVDNKGYNALHYASVASNSFEALVYFIENVPPDNSALSNASVTKAMQLAATYGYDIALSVLLSKLEHPNAYDDHGRTALHLAASNGHANTIKLLLQKGAHVSNHDMTPIEPLSKKCIEQTPVHSAAANGHDACVQMLLDNTEDAEVINAKDALGQTPLMLAMANGHLNTVEMLITHGSLLEAVDKKKRTALFRGAAFGQERCVQALLDQNVSVTKRDIYGKTAFHIAAQCGHVEVLKRLLGVLENSESVHDLVDKDGFTALHCAALGGHESCVDLLISMVNSYTAIKGKEFSPLHCAVSQDRDQCLMLILSQFKESLVNLRDHRMRTLLHIAAYQNAFACYKTLLGSDCSINLKDIHNRTPLMLACYKGHMRIVESLLEKKCDIDVQDVNGDTALHIACQQGHEAIASLILKSTNSKTNCVSHQNNKGQTPLHLAAPLGMMDVTETLLAKGASVTAVDGRNLSPPLACAPNEDVATCLAMILSVFLATPANSEARRSICSLSGSTMRLSESSFSSRLSEVSAGDGTFDANSRTFNVVDSPERSQPTSAVADHPSTTSTSTTNGGLPNAFQPQMSTTTTTKATTLPVSATNPGDVNHNISNGNGTTTD